jgi:hypothetical protein
MPWKRKRPITPIKQVEGNFRENRYNKKPTPLKKHPNTPGKENVTLSEHGHHLRDTVADKIKILRSQGKTNGEIREEISSMKKHHLVGDIIRQVISKPKK